MFSKHFKPLQTAFGAVQDKNTQIAHLKAYQSSLGVCVDEMIVLLEAHVRADKQLCINISTAKHIETLQEKIEKIFTCKAR